MVAVRPTSTDSRALGLSFAIHLCGVAVLGLLAASSIGSVGDDRTNDRCAGGCARVFALRIEHRAVAIAKAATPFSARSNDRQTIVRTELAAVRKTASARMAPREATAQANPRVERAGRAAAVFSTDASTDRATKPNASVPTAVAQAAAIVHEATAIATAAAEPSAQPSAAPKRIAYGTGIYGAHYAPLLRDAALRGEILTQIGARGRVVVAVNEEGRAMDVKIIAPGLDQSAIDELRRRLLSATYMPGERDGIAFEAELEIKPTQ